MKQFFLILLLFAEPGFAQETEATPKDTTIRIVEIWVPDDLSVPKDSIGPVEESPDSEAAFPGGVEAMRQYTMDSLVYPQEAVMNNIQGRVYLRFVVEADGRITHVKIERGADAVLDREAKRFIKNMPPWIPAEKDGKKVRTVCRQPIYFEF